MHRARTAGGIVLGDHGTIAMVRRSDAWLFPKGHVDEGESDEEAARREIYEETGLSDLEYLDDLGTYERYRIAKDGTDDPDYLKEIHMFLFAAPAHAALAPAHEVKEARWVSLSRIAEEIGHPKDRAWFVSVFERIRLAIQRD